MLECEWNELKKKESSYLGSGALTDGTNITFYGGVHEIGGNKFLVEDKGTRIFLDFGMQMGKVNQYYSEYLQPRNLNGMGVCSNMVFSLD